MKWNFMQTGMTPTILVLAFQIFALSGCGESDRSITPDAETSQVASPVYGDAAFAMPDVFSADAVEQVLRSGGNAVDAAVTAAFVLTVTLPEAGNIGGGGFMTIAMAGDAGVETSFLDYRETAPLAASRDMYLDEAGDPVSLRSKIGALSVGVPGTVAGMWAAHQKYGKTPWADLLAPAIALAEEGFLPPEQLRKRVEYYVERVGSITNFETYFGAIRDDEVFRQPQLAATLRRIAFEGPSGFYEGETADFLVSTMTETGGLITHADLEGYKAVWRDPLRFSWGAYDVVSAPLPSSGGIALAQLLTMKEALAGDFEGVSHGSDQYVHLIAEIEKRVFADRAQYLGDPDFVTAPTSRLIDPAYLKERASEVNVTGISLEETVKPGLGESEDTTHFSISDGRGGSVANTYTLNLMFGSGVVVDGAGFLLNDEMDDFSVKPGTPNAFGVVGDEANAIAPGKRMLSSMSPTIFLKDGTARIIIGTPGGSTIFTSVFQAVLNAETHGMTLEEAVDARRFHHQLPGATRILIEQDETADGALETSLTARGYTIVTRRSIGNVQAIRIYDDGRTEAAADRRGRGVARVGPFEEMDQTVR